jgi:RNA polymerase sigma factor (sigma-70 family)
MDGTETAPGTPAAADVTGIVDDASFEAAFREHFAPVYRFIARRVGPYLADDLAADTFATAYRRRTAYRPARASLFGIAVNLLRNHWRAEQRLLDRDAQLASRAAVTALDAASGDLEPRLAAALARLNRGQREVLLLHAWADLGNDEIAAALRIPQGTVRSRLSRARAFVRAELAQPNRPAGNAERNAHA